MDCPNCEELRRENAMLTLKLNEMKEKDHVSREVGMKDDFSRNFKYLNQIHFRWTNIIKSLLVDYR